ncbi:unnamed protein product [Adineta steineri]|uniref:PPM-type phosphatase domain-containing protein n=1 Tax=Adineta steineri TaxID=433720 RepID=A0A815CMN4_9BILA|nr:unnamed protein product [Adineta steineri]
MSVHNHNDRATTAITATTTVGTNDGLLDKPNTKKELFGDKLFGIGSMQGWRRTAEDFYKYLVPLDHHAFKHWNYFAIFDGHNGIDTAKNASHLFDKYLLECFHHVETKIDNHDFERMIKDTLVLLDKNLRKIVHDQSGSVCIATLISSKQIFLINLGDSRGIVISKDGHVLAATKDHKPSVLKEQERIRKAGGHITQSPNDVLRVDDTYAMTRALGDYAIDKHIIAPIPDIIHYPRDSTAAFVILACDGIWDVMSNEEVAKFVAHQATNTALDHIVSHLLDHCLQLQSTDNMTAIIIKVD